jgi:proteasome accessory factor B
VIKTFKLVRISKSVNIVGKTNSFLKPKDFDLKEFLAGSAPNAQSHVVILVRKNQALALRKKYEVEEMDSEWDRMAFEYLIADELIESLLWFGSDVIVLSPESIREKLIANCEELVNG